MGPGVGEEWLRFFPWVDWETARPGKISEIQALADAKRLLRNRLQRATLPCVASCTTRGVGTKLSVGQGPGPDALDAGGNLDCGAGWFAIHCCELRPVDPVRNMEISHAVASSMDRRRRIYRRHRQTQAYVKARRESLPWASLVNAWVGTFAKTPQLLRKRLLGTRRAREGTTVFVEQLDRR